MLCYTESVYEPILDLSWETSDIYEAVCLEIAPWQEDCGCDLLPIYFEMWGIFLMANIWCVVKLRILSKYGGRELTEGIWNW